jgi:predicted RNA-binding protein with PIN domain
VEELLDALESLTEERQYPAKFGAKVYKIGRDEQGNRLTYLKVTGGSIKVREIITDTEEKINQIRRYSGAKYEMLSEVHAGEVCAVTGLSDTYPGQGLGAESESDMPILEPVLNYRIELPPDCDIHKMLLNLKELEEEEPELHIVWEERLGEIHAQLMGEVQIEILKSIIWDRFKVRVEFGTGKVVYKETIEDPVEGVGHFEPLRHYAEVHLLMEPGEAGSGLAITSDCSEDQLDRNWQRLILTHLQEKEHRGVLIGAAITDMKITLIAGRAHLKHTEGGDFRQATYRAVRQGLMQADCVLLEPWYDFRLEIPGNMVGRAMTDIERMHGTFQPPELFGERAVLSGHAPVATMRDYQKEVIAYSRGNGRLHVTLRGYEPCHNTEEVMEQSGYDPLRDTENPADSVFCSHGSGFVVPWDRVPDYMHLPARMIAADSTEEKEEDSAEAAVQTISRREHGRREERWLGTDEIDAILERTVSANKRDKSAPRKDGWNRRYGRTSDSSGAAGTGSSFAAAGVGSAAAKGRKNPVKRDRYLLVDGYNIIFAWEDLRSLADVNIDGARGRLLDILCDYQALAGCEVIAVFDAYRVAGHQTETFDYHNIHVVYTKEAETADQYIEKFTHENGVKYDITVATSDGLEQIIIRGAGSRLLSALDLKEEIRAAKNRLREEYLEKQKTGRNYLPDLLPDEARRQLEGLGGDGQV